MLTDPLAEKETADPVDGGDPEGAGHVTIHVTGHVTVLLQAALQLGAAAQLQAEELLAADPGLELAHPWHGGIQVRRRPIKGSPHRINVRPNGP